MKLYYMTKTKGKAGCAGTAWRVTEDYSTKAELKKAKTNGRTTVKSICTEEELADIRGEDNAERIINEAKPW